MIIERPVSHEYIDEVLAGRTDRVVRRIGMRNGLRLFPLALTGLSHFTDHLLEVRLLRASISGLVTAMFDSDVDLQAASQAANRLDAAASIDRETGSSAVLMACDALLLGLSAVVDSKGDLRTWTKRGLVAGSRSQSFYLESGQYSPSLLEGFELDGQVIHNNPEALCRPLWEAPAPSWFNLRNADLLASWSDGFNYDFWLRWWEGVLSGNQLDWDLQRQVALIPDAIWQQGPAAVAEAIAEIEERFDLRQQVSALKSELESLTTALTQQASAQHRSHNNPPELIDAPAQIVMQVNTLVTTLRETEAELAKPAPDPGVLRRLAQFLIDSAASIVRYCGGLADTMLKKAAEEVGSTGMKWAIRVGGVSIFTQIEPAKDLGKAIIDHVARWLGG